jgi:hypothetical protein
LPAPTDAHHKRIAEMAFSSVYPCYVTKVEKKGRTEAELREVLTWLTGWSSDELDAHHKANSTFSDLFQSAELHANASLITGSICGYRIEELDNPLTKSVRMMDKLVDELAKGRPMDKVLRQG